jgi:hypothetical protein
LDDAALRRAYLCSLATGSFRDREFDEALRVVDVLLVHLYEETGKPSEAAKWRERLQATREKGLRFA